MGWGARGRSGARGARRVWPQNAASAHRACKYRGGVGQRMFVLSVCFVLYILCHSFGFEMPLNLDSKGVILLLVLIVKIPHLF